MNDSSRTKLTRWSLALVILLALAWLTVSYQEWFHELKKMHLEMQWILPLLMAKFASALIVGARLYTVVHIFGIPIRYPESLGLASVTTLAGYVAPMRTASLIRVAYLLRRHEMRISDQITGMAGTSFLDVMASGLLCLAAVGWLITGDQAPVTGLLASVGIALLAGLAGCASLLALTRLHSRGRRKLSARIADSARSSARIFFSDRPAFVLLCLLTVAGISMKGLALIIAFLLAGLEIDWTAVVLAAAAMNIIALLALTPGNIGVTEGAIVGALMAAGVDSHAATTIALLSRAFSLLVQLPLGIVYSVALFGGFRLALQSSHESRSER